MTELMAHLPMLLAWQLPHLHGSSLTCMAAPSLFLSLPLSWQCRDLPLCQQHPASVCRSMLDHVRTWPAGSPAVPPCRPACRISNWFYWCYNGDSTDTGGIVDSSWRDLDWLKLTWLSEYMGLRPWYQGAA
jgi:hypothetical protein